MGRGLVVGVRGRGVAGWHKPARDFELLGVRAPVQGVALYGDGIEGYICTWGDDNGFVAVG